MTRDYVPEKPRDRKAREERERADDYRKRLMAALERATTERWPITVSGRLFQVSRHDEVAWSMPHTYDSERMWELELLEVAIQEVDAEREAEQRRRALRDQARAKLTDDEARAVGLIV